MKNLSGWKTVYTFAPNAEGHHGMLEIVIRGDLPDKDIFDVLTDDILPDCCSITDSGVSDGSVFIEIEFWGLPSESTVEQLVNTIEKINGRPNAETAYRDLCDEFYEDECLEFIVVDGVVVFTTDIDGSSNDADLVDEMVP